jgi:hypothetical protein
VKLLRYIELKSWHSDSGPAWIAYVTQLKSRRPSYFNGCGLVKLKGQRRGDSGDNYIDMETGESFWVSGVKKNGQDRHWAGSGQVPIGHSLQGDLNGFFRAQIKNPRAWATTGAQTVSMLG